MNPANSISVTVVIPTYRRGEILLETLRHLLALPVGSGEIIVVDQTEQHSPEILERFQALEKSGVRRVVLNRPSIPHAMNVGLREAKGEVVLFLDDDIIPDEQLISSHWKTHEEFPEAAAVTGQILQPEEGFHESGVRNQESGTGLRRNLNFRFNSDEPVWVENVMAGNLSVKRERALEIGGFDENFIPPVSYRFETEFAKRLIAAGGKIRFEPAASVRHLRAGRGGTRSRGSHLTSVSPLHGAGDYYYALRCGKGLDRIAYILCRPLREVRTKFHLTHPWYIPVKLLGEIRALALAWRLNRATPRTAVQKPWKLVAVETHPIQYKAPLFRLLARDPRFDLTVLYAMLPDAAGQGDGFGVAFEWDVPLLDGYRYELLDNVAKDPSTSRFSGCDMPGIYCKLKALSPDAVLVNGWGVKTCIQALIACRRLGIPCIVRGEANLLRLRAWWKHKIHDFLLPWYSAFLAIGSANRDFYRLHRIPARKIFCAPYAVDNRFFLEQAGLRRPQRESLRAEFGIPPGATTFLFVGKLEGKKHPLDLLRALNQQTSAERSRAHVLIAGDGDLMSGCKEFASANSLPVMFAGFVNQTRLPDLYAAADVLVLPSDAGETWGLVVNEAMASGLPAIVSRAAGCSRDLILEGETGFTFDVGDIQTLTSLLRRYLAVPDLAMVQGRRAAQHIQNFGLSQIAEGLAAAVGFCMQRRR